MQSNSLKVRSVRNGFLRQMPMSPCKVLDADERNATAPVEPGVSYFDLYRHIQERKLKVWVDVPDPGWGSPNGYKCRRGSQSRGMTLRSKSIRTVASC
jgi:hypothetical protein